MGQVRLVGETAVLECDTSVIVSTAQDFMYRWSLLGGSSLPLERITFTQNSQTLVITNLTIEDSQVYLCRVIAPATNDFFALGYRLSVFGEVPVVSVIV